MGGVSRRLILGGVCGGLAAGIAAPAALARSVPARLRFAEPPWIGEGSIPWRQAEALRNLEPFSVAAPTPHDWREDMDLAHLADEPLAPALLDSDADAPRRRFVLTPDSLSTLLQANRMWPSPGPGRADDQVFLFALRGCVLENPADAATPLERVALRVVPVDHLQARCVIGVWRRVEGRLAVFSGSTTANRHALMLQAAAFSRAGSGGAVWRIANTLPTGAYGFTAGRHGGWHPAALRSADVRGRATPQPAMRSVSGAFRLPDLRLDAALVMDNIHPAVTPADPFGATFSSEGCLTVGERNPPDRWRIDPPDWSAFSNLVGITGARRRYGLALLTGAEGWLASHKRPAPRLRYGSQGPGVAVLRRSLGLAVQGDFDAETLRRVMAEGRGPVAVIA